MVTSIGPILNSFLLRPFWEVNMLTSNSDYNLPPRDINTYGYYGDIKIAASYCGLQYRGLRLNGEWTHGWIPPERNLHPESVIGSTGDARLYRRTRTFYLARQDQVDYLRKFGFTKVKAIGHPFVYLRKPILKRRKGTLLVMPSHSISQSPLFGKDRNIEKYLDYIDGIKGAFSKVVACVHPCDLDYYRPRFFARGIDIVSGAIENDQNSYLRIAILGSSFEFMTTNIFGSHVAYLSYLGCRVSVCGPEPILDGVDQKEIQKLIFYKNAPSCVGIARDLPTALKRSYPFLCVEPRDAIDNSGWAAQQLGECSRLRQADLALQFGWNRPNYDLKGVKRRGRAIVRVASKHLPVTLKRFVRFGHKRVSVESQII
jgi:hypothetical protein